MSFAADLRRHRARHAIPDSVPSVAVPAYTAPLAPLPAARRRAFLAHLRAELAEAFAPARRRRARKPPDPPLASAAAAFVGTACGTCRGECCSRGGEHAYFDADAITRQREAEPGLTPETVLARYTAALIGARYIGSCVFHGAAGCVLPREMRGEVCNSFLCSDLLAGLRRVTPGAPALLVARTGEAIRRVALHRGS